LLDVQKCLRFFGLKLQLSERIVDAIHTKYHDPHECLYYTIHEFLKRVEPRPTWTFIVNVLRSPLINLPRLAQSIEEKFCKRNLQPEQCSSNTQGLPADPERQGSQHLLTNLRLHKGIQTDTPTSCTPDPCPELESEEADTQIDQWEMTPQRVDKTTQTDVSTDQHKENEEQGVPLCEKRFSGHTQTEVSQAHHLPRQPSESRSSQDDGVGELTEQQQTAEAVRHQGSKKDLLSDINELHQLPGSEHQAETQSEVIESIIPTKEQPEPNGDEHARMDEDVLREQCLITELKQQVAEKDLIVLNYEQKLTEAYEIIMRLKAQRGQLEQQVESYKTEIGHLESQLKSRKTIVVDMEKIIQEQNAELETLRHVVSNTTPTSNITPTWVPETPVMQQLQIKCQRHQTTAPCDMQRGSAVTNKKCAYFLTDGSTSVHRYHFNDNKWDELPPCPHTQPGLVIVYDVPIAVGGMDTPHFTNKVLSFKQNKWVEEYPSMNMALSNVAAVSVSESPHNSFIVTVGGCDAFGWSNVVQVFSFSTWTWCNLPSVMPTPLTCPSATVCGDNLYVVGDNTNGFSCSVNNLLAPDIQHWTRLPRLPVTCTTIATLSGQPVIVGGKQNGSPINYIHQLIGERWVKVSSLSCAKHQCLVVSPSPNKMIVVGGVSIFFSLSSIDICCCVGPQ
jgi:hypothetical protein